MGLAQNDGTTRELDLSSRKLPTALALRHLSSDAAQPDQRDLLPACSNDWILEKAERLFRSLADIWRPRIRQWCRCGSIENPNLRLSTRHFADLQLDGSQPLDQCGEPRIENAATSIGASPRERVEITQRDARDARNAFAVPPCRIADGRVGAGGPIHCARSRDQRNLLRWSWFVGRHSIRAFGSSRCVRRW